VSIHLPTGLQQRFSSHYLIQEFKNVPQLIANRSILHFKEVTKASASVGFLLLQKDVEQYSFRLQPTMTIINLR